MAEDPALAQGDEDLFGLAEEDSDGEDGGSLGGRGPGDLKLKDEEEALHHADKVAAYAWPALCAARSTGGSTGLDAHRHICAMLHNAAADYAEAGAASAAARLQFVVASAWHSCLVGYSESDARARRCVVPAATLLGNTDSTVQQSKPEAADCTMLTAAKWMGTSRAGLLKAAKVARRFESVARCAAQAVVLPAASAMCSLALCSQAVAGCSAAQLGD